jgi:hypothetical protein
MEPKPKRGRPKTGKSLRETQINFHVTEDDAKYVEEVANACGFRSRSALCTAIIERLCIGGFSGVAFIKLGMQFANLMAEKKVQKGFYFGVRPFPPLIGDEPDPETAEIIPFINGVKNQIRKENAA